MHITIEAIEYEFKDEPSTRDLMKIGLPPKFYTALGDYQQKLQVEEEAYQELWKDKERIMRPKFETQLTVPESTEGDFLEILEYNGRILNTLYIGTKTHLWEDWLDAPKSILNEAMSHEKIVQLIGKLYG